MVSEWDSPVENGSAIHGMIFPCLEIHSSNFNCFLAEIYDVHYFPLFPNVGSAAEVQLLVLTAITGLQEVPQNYWSENTVWGSLYSLTRHAWNGSYSVSLKGV